jgi:hypothetical protein
VGCQPTVPGRESRAEVGRGLTVVMMVRTAQPHRSEGPRAGCAVATGTAAGLPTSTWATHPLPSGTTSMPAATAWIHGQRRWRGGMPGLDCPGSGVRENRAHGSEGGRRRRAQHHG